ARRGLTNHELNQRTSERSHLGMLRATCVVMGTLQSKPQAVKQVDCVGDLAEVILRYVESCPDAADTLDGICEWWIPRQRYVDAKADVLAALEFLESRGQIHTRTSTDGQVLYR